MTSHQQEKATIPDRQLIPSGRPTISLETVMETYLAGRSPHTQRAYRQRLERFIAWMQAQDPGPFVARLRQYVGHLQMAGLSPRSVQAHITTIKGLLHEAAAFDATGELAFQLVHVDRVKPPPVRGEVQGDRLTAAQRQALINRPGVDTHKGRRDTAILALLSACGLRRSEVCGLSWHHITELDGHKVIRNLAGKHGRVRTVKLLVPLWRLIVAWGELADLDMSPDSPVFIAVRKGDAVQHGQRLTDNAIAYLVEQYAGEIGMAGISPHDLRRTAAALARKRGATIEQVQIMLGHASPQTTSAYIGETINLDDHAVDYADLVIPDI